MKQLELLQREIQQSTEELNQIKPLYDKQVKAEEDITRGYANKISILAINFFSTLNNVICQSFAECISCFPFVNNLPHLNEF